MLRRSILFNGADDENMDSGAETAESDSSKMSSSSSELVASRTSEPLWMSMHLLANPGDSLLLQHTLDRLLRWVCPNLHLFHVSERACPLRDYSRSRLCPVAGYPSLAVTVFLHEAYGEERILRVLDFLQRPPWRYHHTESCGGRAGGVHITSSTSPANALLRPYLLPSRDFYSLGAGMPVWGVRPVHCGGEMLRVTLYSGHDNFEDAVRLYETVLQREAEEQKTGFCWFTLHAEPGLCLQLALKQLSPGVTVEACNSAVLQFRVKEIGQLVPLLPNPCTPISASRWQTEDLDGNKILFQVKAPALPRQPLTCAFPLTCPSVSPRGLLRSTASAPPTAAHAVSAPPPGTHPVPARPPAAYSMQPCVQTTHPGNRLHTDPGLERLGGQQYGRESLGSDSCCSTPPGSSCYSSQRSSPATLSVNHPRDSSPHFCSASPARPSVSVSHLLLEEEPETNVDTGIPVAISACLGTAVTTATGSVGPVTPRSKRPAAVGASALESLARELSASLPESYTPSPPHRTWVSSSQAAAASPECTVGSPARDIRQALQCQSYTREPVGPQTPARPATKSVSSPTTNTEVVDEFFI
ncbi:hypothetical protein DPEC_G00301060 [Dallia pectoralis]|uniref:Uncharacterized protein n=1 Tax=Dallia pectoralis TaxID=75939 RepID=A0ACC2FGL1_DALPE|nr:hypothetical protein DPEC_G00301060 [Dallia pectoralis]